MRTALIALVTVLPATALAQDYDAPRNATVNASGATLLKIDARAGMLRVTGRTDITEVRVRGTARASRKGMLEDIKLEATRTGSEVEVRVIMPEWRDNGWNNGINEALLDLVIETPASLPLDIQDTSGDLTVESVAAKVEIDDNSGNIRVRDAGGDLRISDSSGGIDIRGVKGSVDIVEDSSGEIEVYDVTGSVRVGRDSSGSIDVSRVGGDFTVERDGSGGIEYDGVKGKVDIPRRDRYRRGYR
ncbi:MAG TPA: hypothetical protein VM076_17190 [Gemmatimonadaceae bacterium]|nr:hypothetical protein [Gemmatimonadaceae bacterium]